jgi:hypothetical protein
MSFPRHGEIYPFDEGATPRDRPPAHRNDEFPAGYSSAGCSPAWPASASPASGHLAGKDFGSTMQFQRTANSVLTVCLTPGDNRRARSAHHSEEKRPKRAFGRSPRTFRTQARHTDARAAARSIWSRTPGFCSRKFSMPKCTLGPWSVFGASVQLIPLGVPPALPGRQ